MRALMIIAVLVAGFTAVAPARAADLPAERADRADVFTHRVPHGHRVGPIIVYDFEPGIVVRAYWASPWRHHHYFPFGAKRDADNAPNDAGPPQPAESFERSWSTCNMCGHELPVLRARDEALEESQPMPQPKPAPKK
jgi:hypothetical protein